MIPLIVVAVAVATVIALVVIRHLTGDGEPLDVERQEKWIVTHAPSWSRSWLRTIDHRTFGGVVVGIGFLAVFGCALVVGWIFDTLDSNRGLAQWDESAAQWGSDNATEASTTVLETITRFGGSAYLLTAITLLAGYHVVRRRDWGAALYLVVVSLGVMALNNGLKTIIQRERPAIDPLTGFSGSSFPSGHSAAAAACWAAIALVIARRRSTTVRRLLSFAAVVVAVTVASSRVLLGVHWLTDAVAGVAVGWTWFFLVTVVFGGRLLRLGEPADRIAENRSEPTASDSELLESDEQPDAHSPTEHHSQRAAR